MAQRQIFSMVFLALVSANVIQGHVIRSGLYRPYSIFPQVGGFSQGDDVTASAASAASSVVDNVRPVLSGFRIPFDRFSSSYPYSYSYPSLVGRFINGGLVPSLVSPGFVNGGSVDGGLVDNNAAAASAAASAAVNGGTGVNPGYGYNYGYGYRPSFLRPILRRYWNNGLGGGYGLGNGYGLGGVGGVPSTAEAAASSATSAGGVPLSVGV